MYYRFLPSREFVDVAAIHGTALGYSMTVALLHPYTINKLKPRGKRNRSGNWAVITSLCRMIDFGLRSVGEPAIVHLQTVVKNWIGSITGILAPEDEEIQHELAAKVNAFKPKTQY